MTLPLHIAKKIQEMLTIEAGVPASAMHHSIVQKMLEDGILQKKQQGKTKALLFIPERNNLQAYLHNKFGISDLQQYIEKQTGGALTRADAIALSGNSKLQRIRTFYGFLATCYHPVPGTLYEKPFIVEPAEGTYTFIHEWQHFKPHPSITIVGIENPENFRYIHQQEYLFSNIQPLFVSRYPQNNDLVKWLQLIPNPYLHFGDLDFEGIKIYLHEYKRHLGDKANFFLPSNTEALLGKYGNRTLYDKQYKGQKSVLTNTEQSIEILTRLLHQYKKVLEQEIFITRSEISHSDPEIDTLPLPPFSI